MASDDRLWPIRFKPKDDERLSSWLIRLVHAHGTGLLTFSACFWPGKAIWNQDIDRGTDSDLLTDLANRTATPDERVIATTLRAYEGYLCERFDPANTPWLLTVDHLYRQRVRHWPGQQCCPRCLQNDPEPYWRRRWRLAFMTACNRHHCLLLDHCPQCGEPVSCQRNFHYSPITRVFTVCHRCGFDLRRAASLTPADNASLERALAFQAGLFQTLEQGWIWIPTQGSIYAHLYFIVLRQVLKHIATHRRLAQSLCQLLCVPLDLMTMPRFYRLSNYYLEKLNVHHRFQLLTLAAWLLEDWPERFVMICREAGVWFWDLYQGLGEVPYWYWRVVDERLMPPNYLTKTEEEQIALAAYFRMRGSCSRTAQSYSCLR